jgi:hypothetical protein
MPTLRHNVVYPLGLTVAWLIVFNAGLYGLLRPTQSMPLLTPAPYQRLEFDHGLIGMEGWNTIEHTADGITFQWTSASPASIDIPLTRTGSIEIEFELLQAIQDTIYTEVQLRVNDRLIALDRRDKHYKGVIPASVLNPQSQTLTLMFYTPRPLRPADLDPNSSDIRLLGVAFDWLEVRSVTP